MVNTSIGKINLRKEVYRMGKTNMLSQKMDDGELEEKVIPG